MSRKVPMLALLLATAALFPAGAQNVPSTSEPASSASPTLKDRADQALKTLTLDPMRKADADMKHVLDAHAELNPQPIEKLTPAEARKQPTIADAAMALMKKQGKPTAPEPGVQTRDMTYKGAAGDLPVRIYTPDGAKEPLPVIVYFHGGGWVIADIDVYDASARALAKQANAIVVSAEYRRGPEHKFPAAHEDAFAAYQWAMQNAKSWSGDPQRVAVVGESAGGNLAISVSMMAREKNVPLPTAQVLVYPVAGVNMDTPSYNENENAKPLNKAMMAWFMQHALTGDNDKQDPRIDLVGKANLKGLPPTTIVLAQIDPLRSEGEMPAEKLKQAGVPVEARIYEGVTHEFFGLGALVAKAKDAQAFAVQGLQQAMQQKQQQPATMGSGGAPK